MSPSPFTASIPIFLDCPEPMRGAVAHVLGGEYESGHDGEDLDILDIGANVGAFARWALLRWPASRVRCYEPHPGTFGYLERNTGHLNGVTRVNAAVYPGVRTREPFFSRFAGDGESGLVAYAHDTFVAGIGMPAFDVDVVDPATIRSADIVKIDVEGAEAAILGALDLSATELVLLEFQNGRNRDGCRTVLERDFDLVVDSAYPWDPILDYKGYRADLSGDVFGNMVWRRRGARKIRRR